MKMAAKMFKLDIAIKELRKGSMREGSMTEQEAADLALFSFEYEINLSRSLRHPNLVRCFGASFDGKVFWAVLGLCPGGTLQGLLQESDSQAHVPTLGYGYNELELLSDTPLESKQKYADEPADQPVRANLVWGKRYQIAIDVAYALKFLHQNGICHRDIKSENILLDAKGRALIADLGCAQSDNLVQEEESAVVASGTYFVCSRILYVSKSIC
jgi:serine/threonine protein kinase